MAKNSGNWKIIGTVVTLIVVVGAIATTFAMQGFGVTSNKDTIVRVETKGCEPANVNKLAVALVKKDIEIIRDDISDIKTEQKQGFDDIRTEQKQKFDEILKRLPK